MESWAGEQFRSAEVQDIHDRVAAAGHGSSAIVGAWSTSPDGERFAHAYNVVNHGGAVKVIDGQDGLVSAWRDGSGHPELRNVSDNFGQGGRSLVMGWDARRRSLW